MGVTANNGNEREPVVNEYKDLRESQDQGVGKLRSIVYKGHKCKLNEKNKFYLITNLTVTIILVHFI
jgi:PII-like signaling protein